MFSGIKRRWQEARAIELNKEVSQTSVHLSHSNENTNYFALQTIQSEKESNDA